MIVTALVGCVTAWSTSAQDADGRKGLSEAEANQRRAVVEKYDADGDGVLSKSEQKALSKADKKVLARTGGVGTARKTPKSDEVRPGKQKEPDPARNGEKDPGHQDHGVKVEAKKNGGAPKGEGGGQGKGGKK